MTRDGGAHAVHGYTRRHAPKPELEDGRVHTIFSCRRCLFVHLTECEHPSPTPLRAPPLAPSEPAGSSITSRHRDHQPMTRDGGAHAVHGYTHQQAPKPELEDGRAHAIYSRRRCLFVHLAECVAAVRSASRATCSIRARPAHLITPLVAACFDCSLAVLRTLPRVSAAPPPESNPTRVPNLSSMTCWWNSDIRRKLQCVAAHDVAPEYLYRS